MKSTHGKPRAKAPQTAREDPARGNMKPQEIRPLAMAARQAWEYQIDMGNVAEGEDFDAWRRDQVREAVGRDGLTACDHHHFRPLLARFTTLAGRDEKAFDALMRTGKARDRGAADDTHENRELYAHHIRQELSRHAARCDRSSPAYNAFVASAVAESGKGVIGEPYLLSIARAKSRTKVAGLDDLPRRLTVEQLHQLLSTLRSRIATREGRARPELRSPRKSARRDATPPDHDRRP